MITSGGGATVSDEGTAGFVENLGSTAVGGFGVGSPQHVCPSCGHCPCCGRGGWQRTYPWPYPYGTYPYGPWWGVQPSLDYGVPYYGTITVTCDGSNEQVSVGGGSSVYC